MRAGLCAPSGLSRRLAAGRHFAGRPPQEKCAFVATTAKRDKSVFPRKGTNKSGAKANSFAFCRVRAPEAEPKAGKTSAAACRVRRFRRRFRILRLQIPRKTYVGRPFPIGRAQSRRGAGCAEAAPPEADVFGELRAMRVPCGSAGAGRSQRSAASAGGAAEGCDRFGRPAYGRSATDAGALDATGAGACPAVRLAVRPAVQGAPQVRRRWRCGVFCAFSGQ